MSATKTEETGGPLTVSDRLDELLLRLEQWRPQRRSVMILSGALVVLVAAGWLISGPTRATAVEDSIPMVSTVAEGQDAAVGAQTGTGPDGAQPTGASGAGSRDPQRSGGQTAPGTAAGQPSDSVLPAPEVVVHVAGAVRRPGLVILEPGSRISDAVQAAGGPTAVADVHRLNLAAPVMDGMQVRVPTVDEEVADSSLLSFPESPAITVDGTARDLTVNVNTATAERLEALPGVGPALASAIVSWREDHGPFLSVEDLESVPGIGPSKLAALRDHAIV